MFDRGVALERSERHVHVDLFQLEWRFARLAIGHRSSFQVPAGNEMRKGALQRQGGRHQPFQRFREAETFPQGMDIKSGQLQGPLGLLVSRQKPGELKISA